MRGKTILATFFGIAPPPLLPNVPPLKPNDNRPMRARMQEHASNPVCSGCHLTFEPMGWALENFNLVGQWRNTDAGETVDASGSFIDGSKFNGPAELRSWLVEIQGGLLFECHAETPWLRPRASGEVMDLNDYESRRSVKSSARPLPMITGGPPSFWAS